MNVQWLDADIVANLQGRWASSAVFCYEILITLDSEVELVWAKSWTLPKVLYVISRYGGFGLSLLVTIVSSIDEINGVCRIFNAVEYCFFILSSLSADSLLLVRVCAIYSTAGSTFGFRDVTLRGMLLCCFGLLIVLEVALFIWEFQISVNNNIPLEAEDFGCLGATGLPDWNYSVVAVAILVFNLLMFSMTIIKLFPGWRTSQGLTMEALSTLLIRDGAIYFGLVCTSSAVLTIMVFSFITRPGLQLAPLPWCVVISPIAACRLYLNLKAMGQTGQVSTQPTPTGESTNIVTPWSWAIRWTTRRKHDLMTTWATSVELSHLEHGTDRR
ncbi:hypothetical protein DACRYDRAFT_117453 [Dacryopinax primogenitus]|uniref:DUF6533 domain-containing protein n=1 Tax=Dacryopinax primogenitus (strain DJM 731) TaxID=1858805 RepID=M5FVZ0_DACPD|nr:uncharacterized protein DACRYDRAFT_117453 [Dacryopinax primogenitus]EJT99799.1 hypothetical protein DACRYDRAFT_117453 [Dacryopinax primogenitus]